MKSPPELACSGYADSTPGQAFEKRCDVHTEVSPVISDNKQRKNISSYLNRDFDIFAANTAEMPHSTLQAALWSCIISGCLPESFRTI
jgi:hypothetical protein